MPGAAMPFGLLSQVCHTACSSFAFVRAAAMSFTQPPSLTPHSVALHCVTRFISAGFSPSAAFSYFARRQPHLGCVHLAAAIAHVVPPFRKASLRFTCIVQPPPYPDGKFTPAASYVAGIAFVPHALLPAPLWGLAVCLRSIRSSFSPAANERLANPSVPTSVRHGYASFGRRRFYRMKYSVGKGFTICPFPFEGIITHLGVASQIGRDDQKK